MKILDNVIKSHSIGINCCTNSICTVLKSYGCKFLESEIFGYAGSLGFIYQYNKSDGYFLSGRNGDVILNFAYNFGFKYNQGSGDDFQKLFTFEKKQIDNNIPVIVTLSVEFLPFYTEELGINFGDHHAILVGYDSENVYLLDHISNDVIKTRILDYKNARVAENTSYSARGQWAIIYPLVGAEKEGLRSKKRVIYSMQLVNKRMSDPLAFKMGTKGIKMFFLEVSRLISNLNEDNLEAVNLLSFLMENMGSGGGNFRRTYMQFLNYQYKEYKDPDLLVLAQGYSSLAKLWKQVSKYLKEVDFKNKDQISEEIKEIGAKIYQEESEMIEYMYSYIEKELNND